MAARRQIESRKYVALNPTRNDRALGSFKINWQTGKWSDFANSNAKGRDLISLFAYINSLDQGRAARGGSPRSSASQQITVRLQQQKPHRESTHGVRWTAGRPPMSYDHYYPKNGGPKLKVKIKRRNAPRHKEWLTCYRVIRDSAPTGWQFEKPKDYRDTPYFGTVHNDKFMFWPEGEKAPTRSTGSGFRSFGSAAPAGDGLPKRAKLFLETPEGPLTRHRNQQHRQGRPRTRR